MPKVRLSFTPIGTLTRGRGPYLLSGTYLIFCPTLKMVFSSVRQISTADRRKEKLTRCLAHFFIELDEWSARASVDCRR
jgi:hypothetical protein